MNFLDWGVACNYNLPIFAKFFKDLLSLGFSFLFVFALFGFISRKYVKIKKNWLYFLCFNLLAFSFSLLCHSTVVPIITSISDFISDILFTVESEYVHSSGYVLSIEALQVINRQYVSCFIFGTSIISYFYFVFLKYFKLKNNKIKYIGYILLLIIIIIVFFLWQSHIMNNLDSFYTCRDW